MKLFNIIATSVLGTAMAIGVGLTAANHRETKEVKAAAGDVITFTINIDNVTAAGATWPTNYSTTQTTWSQTVNGVTMSFGAANFTTGTGSNAGTMQNRTNNAGCSYLVNTGLTSGYAIKSIQGASGTARNWDFYGATSTITVSNANPAVITGGTKVGSTNTNNSEHAFGSGSTYDSTNYPYTHFAMVRTGSNAGYYTSFTVKVVELSSAASSMSIKNSSDAEGPYEMSYGDAAGSLFYAKDDSDNNITSGVTWTVSDPTLLTLATDYADNHCWVKPNTNNKVGTATLTASKSGYSSAVASITIKKGDLESIAISGAMTKTAYAIDSEWDPSGLVVTATYDTGFTADVTNGVVWSYSPATPDSLSLTSVVATATYTEDAIQKTASTSAITVSVFQGVTYDLSKISGFNSWDNTYSAHDVTSAQITGATIGATLNFKITNKQSSGVGSTYPCIGAKTSTEVECLKFTLTEPAKKISSISITFVTRYTSTFPSLYLHKGAGLESASLADLTMSGANGNELVLSYDNLNDTIFTVGYNAHQTGSNGAVGIKSITLGLAEAGAFGTTDHIKVTSYPRTIYHVGELYDETGLVVTAYDDADEAIANFKDVTAEISTGFKSGVYRFDDGDVPTVSMWVEYLDEDSNLFETNIDMDVYALAEYELVESELDDWSGNYLIVSQNADSDLVAMDGSLANPDSPTGYKVVTDNTNVIEAGQELEWTIAKVTGGYAISGKSNKYIGSLTAKSNGMLVSETSLVNTLEYDGTGVAISGTNDYHLTFNTDGDRFRYYASGNVQLYKLKDSTAASDYADTFLDLLSGATPVCKVDGSTDLDELKTAWKMLADEYDTLGAADKEQFRLGVASSAPEATNIAKALALYDYIAAKYNTQLESAELADYNFMNRSISPLSSSSTFNNNVVNAQANVALIVIVSVISLAAVATFFILRKKRFSK